MAMNVAGYPPDHSLPNNFGANKFNQMPLSIYALIEYLSLFLTPYDIVDLSHQLRRLPDADLHVLATSYRRRCMSCRIYHS
jgi:hypothetical protein